MKLLKQQYIKHTPLRPENIKYEQETSRRKYEDINN
jgi:hypothetical protein